MAVTLPAAGDVESQLRAYAVAVDREIAAALEEQVDDEWMRGAVGYQFGWADADFKPLTGDGARLGGKKLRPGLALLSYQGATFDGTGAADTAEMVAFAAALELLHNYSLVHDDIQDRDRSRRGRPTLWTICGEAQAINVGNCMHVLAFGCLDRLRDRGFGSPVVADVVAALARASITLTVGQKRDIAFETEPDVTTEMYLQMIDGKTAALTRCATYGGALLALGRDDDRVESYGRFGRLLGLGFQIRDDILGIWGDERETGKSSGSDIRRKKKSLPVLFAFGQAPPADRARLRDLYAQEGELSPEAVDEVRSVLEACGAQRFSQEQAEAHRREAREALTYGAGGGDALRTNPFVAALDRVADFVTGRAF